MSREARAKRFIAEFGDVVDRLAPPVGATYTVVGRDFVFSEREECVRLRIDLASGDGDRITVYEPLVYFDPDRDMDFEAESVAGMLDISYEAAVERLDRARLMY